MVDIQEDYLKWFLSKAQIVSVAAGLFIKFDLRVSKPDSQMSVSHMFSRKWNRHLLHRYLTLSTKKWFKKARMEMKLTQHVNVFLCRRTFPQWTCVPTRSYWTPKPRQPCCRQTLNCKCRYLRKRTKFSSDFINDELSLDPFFFFFGTFPPRWQSAVQTYTTSLWCSPWNRSWPGTLI